MKRIKADKGLLDKEKFEAWQKEKKHWLKNLSLRQALRLEESLISSELIWLWRKNFLEDNPICLKDNLKAKA